jgi:HSP20 family protein
MKLMKAPQRMPSVFPEFERMFPRWFATQFKSQELPLLETEWAPSLDCSETDVDYVVQVEAPGVHKENLDVNLEGNVLTVTGHRESKKEHESEAYIWKEREEGRFVRSLRLPKTVDGEKVNAVYQDGVLTIRVPKAEPAVKSRIAVK